MADILHTIIVKIKTVQEGVKDFGRGLAYNTNEMKRFGTIAEKDQKTGVKWAVGLKKLVVGLRGFRMEMLSVMFFGLGLQKFFMGLLQPALAATGVFDVLGAALTILFLPAAMMLLDWALKFLDWVTNMPEGVQNLINKIVLWGVAIGTALFAIGSFVLGLGGLITAFGGVIGFVITLGAAIIGLVTSPFALAVAAVILLAIKSGALGPVWEGIKSVLSSFLDMANTGFQWLLDKFPALRTAMEKFGLDTSSLKTVFTSLGAKIEQAMGETFNKIKAFFGFAPTLDPTFMKASPAFQKKMQEAYADEGIFAKILRAFKTWWSDVSVELIKDAKQTALDLVSALITGIGTALKATKTLFGDTLKTWWAEGMRELSISAGFGAKASKILNAPAIPPPTASGGIVTSPQVRMVGEAGPEAIIPLDKAGGFGSVTVNVNVTGYTDRDLISNITNAVRDELERTTRRA